MFLALVETIRTGHIKDVEEMTALIRSKNGSIEDIANFLGHRMGQFSDAKALSAASRLSTSDDGEHEPPLREPLDNRARRPSEVDMVSSPEEHQQHLE